MPAGRFRPPAPDPQFPAQMYEIVVVFVREIQIRHQGFFECEPFLIEGMPAEYGIQADDV